MKHHTAGLHPLKIFVVIGVLLLIFLSWLISVVLPITVVELTYQYRKSIGSSMFPKINFGSTDITSKYANGIVIPSIYIDEPVIFNVDPNNAPVYLDALKHGIAHASGTAFPGTGGLGYYFAHSSLPAFVSKYNAVFYLLDKLQIGDSIAISHEGTVFEYIVYAKQRTSPDDVSFLKRPYEKDSIVLQTCWPPGSNSGRLLVFAMIKAK